MNASIWKWIYNPEYGVLNAVLTRLHILSQYRAWLSDPFLAMNMVIVADVWKMTPFAIIFFLAALQFINKSLYEAATVDGAGVFETLLAHHPPLPRADASPSWWSCARWRSSRRSTCSTS